MYYIVETLRGPGRVRYLFDAPDIIDALQRLAGECWFAGARAVLWQDGHRIARARVVGARVEIVTE